MLVITQRHAEAFGFAALYANLIVFDWILYGRHGAERVLMLSSLRFFLLACPMFLGSLLIRLQPAALFQKTVLAALWLFFLPYTIYSVIEIRHVSELCRLAEGAFYAPTCLPGVWMLLPAFAYAMAGTLAFVFSVSSVTNKTFQRSWLKRIAILGICAYSALSSTFGLYSRLNAWDSLTRTKEVLDGIRHVFGMRAFLYDSIAVGVFFIVIFFVMNRLVRWGNRYIDGKSL